MPTGYIIIRYGKLMLYLERSINICNGYINMIIDTKLNSI